MQLRTCSSAVLLMLAVGLPAAEPSKQLKPVPAAAIAKLVADAAASKPDWWDQVALNYPPTLDLTCAPAQSGAWDSSKIPSQWMWDVVNPNPGKWMEATKFWHFVLANARQNNLPNAEKEAMQALIHCYGDLLQDWPRAVYWNQIFQAKYGQSDVNTLQLANAYWRLGNKTMAIQTAKPLGGASFEDGSLIKFCADLGEYKTAYQLAEAMVSRDEDVGWFMAGYTAQLEGAWDKALACFKKAEAAPQSRSSRRWQMNHDRAAAAVQAITLFQALELKNVADGTYTDASTGYSGPVTVEINVAHHKITAVRVTSHQEKQYYASLDEVPAKIIARQQVKGVDGTLGATITSDAIIYATAKALHQGRR